MDNQFNKPERGGKPGVYEIENAEGEKVRLYAETHPHADAFIRMQAKYVMSIEEWRAEELKKRQEEIKAKESPKTETASDKKGK